MRNKPFHAFQIELTTRCPLKCKMCVKTPYGYTKNKVMDFRDFEKILPHISLTEYVVLEGWGESLSHKDLLKFIRTVKEKGAKTGFVTCGMGLTREKIKELLEEGIDFVGFSLSGAKRETHKSIRVGSDFNSILDAIRILSEEKQKLGREKPEVHIAYLMLKENIMELPDLVELSESLSIKKIILLNIIQITTPDQNRERVFEYEGENIFEEVLKRTEKLAKKKDIEIVRPYLVGKEVAICDDDPLRNLYISVNGDVSPCVFLFPPVSSPFRRIFRDREYHIEKVSFGNVFLEDLMNIWEKRPYKEFRERFVLRKKTEEQMLDALMSLKPIKYDSYPPPPEPCTTCHKILGL